MPSLESASQRAARSWHMGDPSNLQSWAQTHFPVWAYIKIFTRGTFLSTAERRERRRSLTLNFFFVEPNTIVVYSEPVLALVRQPFLLPTTH